MKEIDKPKRPEHLGSYDIPRNHIIYRYDPEAATLEPARYTLSQKEKNMTRIITLADNAIVKENIRVMIWEPGVLYVHALNEKNAWKRVMKGKFIFPNVMK